MKSQKGDLSYKKFLFICLICVLLVFTHYQIFFLLPGFYFALFLREERKIQSLKKYKSKPPFLFFKKNGVYENLLNTKNHKEQLIAYYETMIRLKKNALVNVLNKKEINEIIFWEKEIYRRNLK